MKTAAPRITRLSSVAGFAFIVGCAGTEVENGFIAGNGVGADGRPVASAAGGSEVSNGRVVVGNATSKGTDIGKSRTPGNGSSGIGSALNTGAR